ncbi:MAG: cysteine desulfurase NifS, partial [Candidatus Nanopelagicales bacterium]|nr:cysteine desulfurase NifS [Candidatus Nanopelagicales bacterium]
ACSAGVAQPSRGLLAMGASPEAASQSLRFSLGWTSTDRDIADVLRVLPDAVSGSRSQGRVAVGSH